jgi:DNA polymerase V
MSSIALVDCNNFFVSCERLFNPKLHKIPVVVLSNNDGCIIARSDEAKALGIPMGAPLFEWRALIERKKVYVTSSNFPLYGDLSARVMSTLESEVSDMEIYSIDEAFLHLGEDPEAEARRVQQKVAQWVGIPVSIGIGPTKTLAKLASYYAKRRPELRGVYAPSNFEPLLDQFPVEEVWGIGRCLAKRLARHGIFTCAQLIAKSDTWIRKEMSVVGLRTVWELRGEPALEIEEEESRKQSIMSSRLFGRPVTTLQEIEESVAFHASRASERMRREESEARYLQVYLRTKEEGGQTRLLSFPQATDYAPYLITAAKKCARALFSPHLTYKKSGVLLSGLAPKESFQPDFFTKPLPPKCSLFQKTIDSLNDRYGRDTAFFAAQGIHRNWQTKRGFCSPCYTTRWDELLTIDISKR